MAAESRLTKRQCFLTVVSRTAKEIGSVASVAFLLSTMSWYAVPASIGTAWRAKVSVCAGALHATN
jgi:hypothetical protein